MTEFLAEDAARRIFLRRLSRGVLADPQFQETFGYSVMMALLTIVFGILLDRADRLLGAPASCRRLRPLVEFITLLPLVIPAIVIVFGYHPPLQHVVAGCR